MIDPDVTGYAVDVEVFLVMLSHRVQIGRIVTVRLFGGHGFVS